MVVNPFNEKEFDDDKLTIVDVKAVEIDRSPEAKQAEQKAKQAMQAKQEAEQKAKQKV